MAVKPPYAHNFSAAALVLAVPCIAQQQAVPGMRNGAGISGVPPLLQRVEQNVADVGPLSDTLREMDFQVDMRDPVGFSNVYRVPGRSDLFMRSSGAVYAVFSQSQYVENERGVIATVPAGTTFSIGMPAPWTLPQRQIQPSMQQPKSHDVAGHAPVDQSSTPGRHDTRINTLVGATGDGDNDAEPAPPDDDIVAQEPTRRPPPEAATMLRTIATDETYRAARLAELLNRAAQATHTTDG